MNSLYSKIQQIEIKSISLVNLPSLQTKLSQKLQSLRAYLKPKEFA